MTPLPNIMVAPNGARRGKADHPALPITLPQIIETTKACALAGADGVHLHLRDQTGAHMLDAGAYHEALAEFDAALPDFYVQVTTEAAGRYTPAQQRQLLSDLTAPAISVAPREITADGNFPDAQRVLMRCTEQNTAIQFILYDTTDFDLLDQLALMPQQLQFLFVLGRYTSGQQSDPKALAPFLTRTPQADWAVCAFGLQEIACLQAAQAAGGKLRIGFENAIHRSDGSLARDNAERVHTLQTALSQRPNQTT